MVKIWHLSIQHISNQGEILDFLIILPFLNEGPIFFFHDIGNQITKAGKKNSRKEWAPYLIFNILRFFSMLV